MKRLAAVLTAIMLSATALFGAYQGGGSDIMLQGFHWLSANGSWWTTINNNATAIQSGGFTMVWLPPVSLAASTEGYLPTQWYNLGSRYGSQSALQTAINTLHGKNVKVLADIVINHRCGTANWADFSNPSFANNQAAVCYNDEWGQGTGAADSGMGYDAGRDLDHGNASVQTETKNWMNWLKNTIGFDGWRYDYVKGYSGYYNGIYNDATAPYFSVGEYWADITGDYYASAPGSDYHRQKHIDWINASGGKTTAFDFTTKWQLMHAVSRNEYWRLKDGAGKPVGVIGWWPAMAVTFIDNHDTGPSPGGGQNHWPFPSGKEMEGYAYILTHPGTPSVYWPHYFDWGTTMQNELKKLISIRKIMGLKATSTVSIQVAESTRYAAIIDSKVAMKIGSGSWTPTGTWVLAASGVNYAVWTNGSGGGGGGTSVRTVVFMLKETVTGQDIFIKGGHDAGLVPGVYPSMSEPITYLNTKNATTAAIKAADASLDWGTESALDWTCNLWPSSWGTKRTYAVDGYGEDPENTFGLHYWKLDVMMSGSAGEWFEFKAFMRQGTSEWWENNIAQSGTPYATINHWGKKGYKTVTSYGGNAATFYPL